MADDDAWLTDIDPKRAWLASRRAWADSHPGHCVGCGLPIYRCFHRDGTWERERPAGGSIDEYLSVLKVLYVERLERMSLEELEALPYPPPKKAFIPLLKGAVKERRAWVPPPSVWERLLGEDLV